MSLSNQLGQLPSLVIHADWSVNPKKRVMAQAKIDAQGIYHIAGLEMVGDLATFISRLRQDAGPDGSILLGFDFPIGLPYAYARAADIQDFLAILPRFGQDEWSEFYSVAEKPEQIHLKRPFYPKHPGTARRSHLVEGLAVENFNTLLRTCEQPSPGRRAACPLFWTLGGQQAGKAAISGWKGVLGPAVHNVILDDYHTPITYIWPFSGLLGELIQPGKLVIVETYPAEFYTHFLLDFTNPNTGKRSGKRDQDTRASNAPRLLSWVDQAEIQINPLLRAELQNGFGPAKSGEDSFDAIIGLFGMLNTLFGDRQNCEPEEMIVRLVEGWIFGQRPPEDQG